jgi:hypothetical protein
VGLIRLLLQCRFDFRHKTWGIPVFAFPPDGGLVSAPDHTALLPLLVTVLSDFSDPAVGGKPRKPEFTGLESGQTGFRKQQNQKGKNETQ